MRLVKGHGTQNDFLVLPDLDGTVEVTPAAVRALCDRHAGIGADGILRVVRCAKEPAAAPYAADAEFFMDYRNADGSVAEMCGNGVRVFLRYLQGVRLVGQSAAVATRGGIRRARARGDGNVTVQMGSPRLFADRPIVTAALSPNAGQPPADPPDAGLLRREGVPVDVPNPHVVVTLDTVEQLAGLDLRAAPDVVPPRPDGQNVEFVVVTGARSLTMRVHERGVGETRSCGTGICAAAVAVASAQGGGPDAQAWTVEVPGGCCEVVWRADGEVELTGPAVLVGTVDVDDAWLSAAGHP